MKKIVIANWGASKQGKTSTIKLLIEIIKQRNSGAKLDRPITGVYDIRVIITLTSGIKIGIETAGDPGSPLEESRDEFVKNNCDVIICCTRTKGKTERLVDNLAIKHKYEIVWVTNYRSNELRIDKLNQLSAEKFYELLDRRMNNLI